MPEMQTYIAVQGPGCYNLCLNLDRIELYILNLPLIVDFNLLRIQIVHI